MCGIAGWIDFSGLPPEAGAVVARINDVQAHRGPDASGLWVSRVAAIAHRRLSVIDVEHGAQPMTLPHGGLPTTQQPSHHPHARYVLSYNGEVYNHVELRRELRSRGHVFRTASDSEVVLVAWAEWGPQSVSRLNGIFAFAVWDTTEETLWLARDHLGVKPLHVHAGAGSIVFASEAKAVLAHPDIDTTIDRDGLRQLLLPLVTIPGATPYRGVDEVPPGHVIGYSRSGVQRIRYWDFADVIARPSTAHDAADAAAQLKELLHDTVARQTISDVPLCTFLSGGLDSSAITAIANGLPRGDAVRSFSVDFADISGAVDSRSALDRHFARAAADHIGSAHENIVLSSALLADRDVRDEAVRARDLPNGFGDLDPSLLLLCREIRKYATVALSGEAADEILGGYRWFAEPGAVWAETFPWVADTPAHGHLHQRLLRSLDAGLVAELELDSFVRDEYTAAIGELDLEPGLSRADRRHREIVYLAASRFLPMLLARNDRLSMANGLEVRVPFCDPRIIELVVTLSQRVHNAGGREKGVLRDAIGELLPESVRERTKSPYPTSPDPAYSRLLAENLREVLAAPAAELQGIFAAEVLDPSGLADAARSDGLVSNLEGEVVLNFASWLRQYEPSVAL